MTENKANYDAITELLKVLGDRFPKEIKKFKEVVASRAVMLETEEIRLLKKGYKESSPRVSRTRALQKNYRKIADYVEIQRQIASIRPKLPTQDTVVIQGRVVDDRYHGMQVFDGRILSVSLLDNDLEPIPNVSKKLAAIDEFGSFVIELTSQDLELIEKRGTKELTLVVVGKDKKIIEEFEPRVLSEVSVEVKGRSFLKTIHPRPAVRAKLRADREKEEARISTGHKGLVDRLQKARNLQRQAEMDAKRALRAEWDQLEDAKEALAGARREFDAKTKAARKEKLVSEKRKVSEKPSEKREEESVPEKTKILEARSVEEEEMKEPEEAKRTIKELMGIKGIGKKKATDLARAGIDIETILDTDDEVLSPILKDMDILAVKKAARAIRDEKLKSSAEEEKE